jgi:hypothetical protein
MDYSTLTAAAAEMGEEKDCAVRALSAVSGRHYKHVHEFCRIFGRRKASGTDWKTVWQVAGILGLVPKVTTQFTAKTVTTLERQLPKKGKFLVSTRGHILAAVDGKIIDWTQGRRHRVLRVWEIT